MDGRGWAWTGVDGRGWASNVQYTVASSSPVIFVNFSLELFTRFTMNVEQFLPQNMPFSGLLVRSQNIQSSYNILDIKDC